MDLVQQGAVVLCKFWFSNLRASKNRPVLVLKDNLPYDDFIAAPISSRIDQMHADEMLLTEQDFVEGSIPVTSKVMLRKPFVASKTIIFRKYGVLSDFAFRKYHNAFCQYFECRKI